MKFFRECEFLLVFCGFYWFHVTEYDVKIFCFRVPSMVHGFMGWSCWEMVLSFQVTSKLGMATCTAQKGLGNMTKTWFLNYFKWPNGLKMIILKSQNFTHLKLIKASPKMPFWLVKFWHMKVTFLERGDQMWLVGKNPTQIGQMVWEIWPFEVQEFLETIRS